MSKVELKKFGMNLSGRPLGISSYQIILQEHVAPFELDFSGVTSIGSSFADEVVVKLAQLNGGHIVVYQANNIIMKCLSDAAREHKLNIEKGQRPSI